MRLECIQVQIINMCINSVTQGKTPALNVGFAEIFCLGVDRLDKELTVGQMQGMYQWLVKALHSLIMFENVHAVCFTSLFFSFFSMCVWHMVIKDYLLNLCNTVISFDTSDVAKHNSAVDLGFSADRIIRSDGFKRKKVSERNMVGSKSDAKSMLIALYNKLIQKTPITYQAARSLSCLNPRTMASAPEQSRTTMKMLFVNLCWS